MTKKRVPAENITDDVRIEHGFFEDFTLIANIELN